MRESATPSEEIAEFGRILNSISRALEARNPYTLDHSQRVAEIASSLALSVGLTVPEAETIQHASWIHDLGEISIPERSVTSSAHLTPEEEALIRAHPTAGYEMLRSAPSLASLLPFVLMHHERLDGSGYPEGLVGKEIPRAVQILSLADAYDALASPRPYRRARSRPVALQILQNEARNGAWDIELVEGLVAISAVPASIGAGVSPHTGS